MEEIGILLSQSKIAWHLDYNCKILGIIVKEYSRPGEARIDEETNICDLPKKSIIKNTSNKKKHKM